MKINLEVIQSSYLYDQKEIELLQIKELVPNMMLRRRLTRSAKILIELENMVGFKRGRIFCGSAYGEVGVSVNILQAIDGNYPISPTDFQNSVYNTGVSYLSISSKNQNEILTISCGENTSKALLKLGAVKALDGDEILLLGFETLNVKEIQEINSCIEYLEVGVALVVKLSQDNANTYIKQSDIQGVPSSMSELLYVAQEAQKNKKAILEVSL